MEAQGLRTREQLLGVQRTVGLLWGAGADGVGCVTRGRSLKPRRTIRRS